MTRIEAVVFDMDGLLIDSEPFWQEAETEIFGSLGIDLKPTNFEMTMGKRLDEVVEYWHKKVGWVSPSREVVRDRIVEHVIGSVRARGQAKPGVENVLRLFSQRSLPMAVASSSFYRIIDAVLLKLELREMIPIVHSAEDEIQGKPSPEVYLGACRKLQRDPSVCLAFEDSPHGVRAAVAAGLKCVFIPDASVRDFSVSEIADVTIPSLLDFSEALFMQLSTSSPKRFS